jgi:hypothetical protein
LKITFSDDALGSETPEIILSALKGYVFNVTLISGEVFEGELWEVNTNGHDLVFARLIPDASPYRSVNRETITELEVL